MMDAKLRVLIAEDTEDDALLLIRALRKGGYTPDTVRVWNAKTLSEALLSGEWDIILSDYHMPGFGGDKLIQIVRDQGIDTPIIIVSGAIGEEAAVELVKSGAEDYVMKDNLIRLIPSISRALKEAEDRKERRRAEEALRESEERYRSLILQISEGIIIFDQGTGKIIESNEKISEIFGYTEDEIHSMTIDGLIPGCIKREAGHRVIPENTGLIEGTIHRKGGEARDIEVSLSHIPLKGNPDAASAVIRDITEKKEAERTQIQALIQIDRNIEQFAILADNIRNPLQVIIGYSALSTDEHKTEIVEQVDRINEIIKQLDQGWIDSDNVRRFLRRNYSIGSFERPDYITQ
jgi:PAS domain S-box-containing protein